MAPIVEPVRDGAYVCVYGSICSVFAGLLDEVSVYNRALTPSEIAAIYAAGSAGKCWLESLSLSVTNSVPLLSLKGLANSICGIQSTLDLSNTNSWAGRANVTLTNATQLWYDSQPATQPQTYYRVLPGPISIP